MTNEWKGLGVMIYICRLNGGGGILPAVNTLSYGLDSERMNKSFYCRSYDNSDKRLSRNLVIAVRFRKITNESLTVLIPKRLGMNLVFDVQGPFWQ